MPGSCLDQDKAYYIRVNGAAQRYLGANGENLNIGSFALATKFKFTQLPGRQKMVKITRVADGQAIGSNGAGNALFMEAAKTGQDDQQFVLLTPSAFSKYHSMILVYFV